MVWFKKNKKAEIQNNQVHDFPKYETKAFDLNIERILENWDVYHAIREIIANALDEMTITQTSMIDIVKDANGLWHVRDYGRGLNYHHLTQNESDEKKKREDVIGKFGIGLKDAFAKEINSSVASINRWENGRGKPNLTTMKHIKEFCEKHNLPYGKIECEWLSFSQGGKEVND